MQVFLDVHLHYGIHKHQGRLAACCEEGGQDHYHGKSLPPVDEHGRCVQLALVPRLLVPRPHPTHLHCEDLSTEMTNSPGALLKRLRRAFPHNHFLMEASDKSWWFPLGFQVILRLSLMILRAVFLLRLEASVVIAKMGAVWHACKLWYPILLVPWWWVKGCFSWTW